MASLCSFISDADALCRLSHRANINRKAVGMAQAIVPNLINRRFYIGSCNMFAAEAGGQRESQEQGDGSDGYMEFR